MNTVMTKPSSARRARPRAVEPVPVTSQEQALQQTAAQLAVQCREVKWDVHWLPGCRKTSSSAKLKMVNAVGGKTKGYSTSKRLFSADHEKVKKLNELRRELGELRDRYTIVKATPVEDADDEAKAEQAVRLICVRDVPVFEAAFHDLRQRVAAAVVALQASYDEIKALDQERLGDEFNPADYPDQLVDLVYVSEPVYGDLRPASGLPEAVHKRQLHHLDQVLTESVDAMTRRLAKDLGELFGDFARSLGERTRINPVSTHELAQLKNPEILRIISRHDDATLDEHSVRLEIKYRSPAVKATASGPSVDPAGADTIVVQQFGPYTQDELHKKIRPLKEKRPVHKSVIARVQQRAADFQHIREMLGPAGAAIGNQLDKVVRALSNSDDTPEKIQEQLRTDDDGRTNLATTLTEAAAAINLTAADVSNVRRRLNTRLAGLD